MIMLSTTENPTTSREVSVTAAESSLGLNARYTVSQGRVFLSGNQALVRLPLQQRLRDQRAGLRTGGFISGYRGSPLGRLDMELWQIGDLLREHQIHFQPGINEDLAATAVWGTQQVPNLPGAKVDGVFGIWYGKGPGVDRSGDAIKHANAAGTSALGGVLALAGDDHAAKSSTQAHQSEQSFVAAGIPVLYPSNVQEILDYGLIGLAMSRHAGVWVALKVVTDVVEGSGSVSVDPDQPDIVVPDGGADAGDWHIKRFEAAPLQERSLYEQRLPAALAFARANGLNRIEDSGAGARLGIVSAGKSWADLQQALLRLEQEGHSGLRERVRLLKVGMVWPLDADVVTRFAEGLDAVLVIEEKRPLLEDQIKTTLFDVPGSHPRVTGKFDAASAWSSRPGRAAVSMVGELSPAVIATRIADWMGLERSVASAITAVATTRLPDRAPTFCSGCPHSTSTRVPDGSIALAGIGCHSLALLNSPETTGPISHMGAEGVMWVGQSPFTENRHMFANIGDGTYFHSGFLAIRQAVAAKVTITYKLLLNGFVSMTGGQPIEGELTPAQLSTELLAEGVVRVVVVTDDPGKYSLQQLPAGVAVFHRERLDAVQRELREQAGVSVLIYDQMCATERRRLRKRGKLPEPSKRTFINAAVCEGCGDCGTQSNCLSVEPLATELGRKRRINQASCNKDFSCVQGFCPSFVTVHGGSLRKPAKTGTKISPHEVDLPEPTLATLHTPIGLIVTGIGGTGVITVGAILTMAAHLDGLQASALDLTGLAQKYGAVMSHIRLGQAGAALNSYRLGLGEADVVIGCDLVVTGGDEAVSRMTGERTRVVVNSDVSSTRDFTQNPDWSAQPQALNERLTAATAELQALPASRIATELMGDPLAANLFLVGYAWQKGWLPIRRTALEHAIRLNGVGVEANLVSFAWGRVAAHAPDHLEAARRAASPAQVLRFEPGQLQKLDAVVAHRSAALTQYQNAAYAQRYRTLVERVAVVEREAGGDERVAKAVARYYYKLLAYKDEFEVARLYSTPEFAEQLRETFDGDFRLHLHLGAGPFARRDPATGKVRKTEVGPWVLPVLRGLSRLRFLRGSLVDPFRRSEERVGALEALACYEADVERLLKGLRADRLALAAEVAAWPEGLRGYGHVRAEHRGRVEAQRNTLWQRWETSGMARAA